MKKKWVVMIMAAMMMLNFASCRDTNDPTTQTGSPTGTEAEPTASRMSDDEIKKELNVGELQGEGANPDAKAGDSAKTLYVKDYGAKGDGVNNDGSPIKKALTALKKAGPGSVLVFEPNTTYYVSSGNYAVQLAGLKDVTIKGENTTILAKPIMGHLAIQNCDNVVVQGLNFDYKTKPYAIATVIEDKGKGIITIQTDRSLNFRGTYKQPCPDYFGIVDRTDGRYHVGITSMKVISADEYTYEVQCNTTFTDMNKRVKMMTDEGYKFIVPMPEVGQAIEQGFTIISNHDVTMKDCNVWSAAKFMFYLNDNTGVIKFDNLHITPSPDEKDAHIVGWRDGFHCKENRAQLVWENCSAEYLYDDIFNVACSMLYVKKVDGKNVSLAWQETGTAYPYIAKGDVISFFDTSTGEFLGKGTVQKMGSGDAALANVVLTEEVEGLRGRTSCKAVVDTLGAPNSIIRNCDFQGTFRFRSPIYITDSKFHMNRMWLDIQDPVEGPLTNNVLFSNCEFLFDNENDTYIHVDSYNKKWEKAENPYSIKNIVFFHCKLRESAVEIGDVEKNTNQVRFIECYN